jgi:PST family polysaccharide transporter
MRFVPLARADVISASLGLLSTIAIAARIRSPVALAVGSLVSSIVGTLLVWKSVGYYDWVTAKGHSPREIWKYGGGLVGFTTINYWARNVDNLLIGKWLGPAALGLYSRAYNLMLLPVNQVIAALNPVILPMLAALQADPERFRRAYISALRAIAFVTFPIMAGLAVTAYPFIVVVFGSRWAEAAPLLQILAWVGLLQSLTNPTGLIYLSTGGTARLLRWGLFGSSACIIALIIGALLGSARTVAGAYLVVNVLLTYPAIAYAGAPVGLRFGHVLAATARTLVATTVMTAFVACADRLLTTRVAVMPRLLADVFVGASTYFAVSFAARNPALTDFRRFLRMDHIQN